MSKELTAEQVRELLDYDPETGKLYWRNRDRNMFPNDRIWKTWNTRYSGKEAFTTVHPNGYLRGGIFKKDYLAHRVIWVVVHGYWPTEIDHVDRDAGNNRLSNIREVSHAQNAANRVHPVGKSGHRGTFFFYGKWRTHVMQNQKVVWRGSFSSPEAASAAYEAKSRELFGEFNR